MKRQVCLYCFVHYLSRLNFGDRYEKIYLNCMTWIYRSQKIDCTFFVTDMGYYVNALNHFLYIKVI